VAEQLEQSAFACAIFADDAHDIALLDTEGDVFEGPDVVALGALGAVIDLADLEVGVFFAKDGGLPPAVDVVLEGACADKAETILLAYIVEFYGYVGI